MTKIEIAKKTLSVVAGFGAGKIVSGVVKNNVQPQSLTDQVSIAVATYSLGCAAGEIAGNAIERQLESFHKVWTELREKTVQD